MFTKCLTAKISVDDVETTKYFTYFATKGDFWDPSLAKLIKKFS